MFAATPRFPHGQSGISFDMLKSLHGGYFLLCKTRNPKTLKPKTLHPALCKSHKSWNLKSNHCVLSAFSFILRWWVNDIVCIEPFWFWHGSSIHLGFQLGHQIALWPQKTLVTIALKTTIVIHDLDGSGEPPRLRRPTYSHQHPMDYHIANPLLFHDIIKIIG